MMMQASFLEIAKYQTDKAIFPCHVCQEMTKQFNLALNLENGHFRRVCLNSHTDSQFGMKYLPYPNLCKLIKGFDLVLTKKPINSLNELFQQFKQPEKTLEKLINQMTLTQLPLTQLYQSLSQLTTLESIITLSQTKIKQLTLLRICQTIEPIETKIRLEINKLEREEFQTIISTKKNLLQSIDLQEANKYLTQLPDILKHNLIKTYPLPQDLYQLRQTNGFQVWQEQGEHQGERPLPLSPPTL